MKRNTLVMVFITILLVLVIGLTPIISSCKAEPEAQTLKIGVSLPFQNPIGLTLKKYYEAIVPWFNEAGGLEVNGQRYNIELIIYDDKYTADGGRASAERLIHQDGVKYIIGVLGSAPAAGMVPVTEAAGALLIGSCSTDKLVAPTTKYTVRGAGTGIPGVITRPTFMVKQFPNAKTVVICSPDDETGHFLSPVLSAIYKSLGIETLDQLFAPREEVDFAPVATKIKSLNPDIADFTAWHGGTTGGLQVQALWDAGWRGAKSLQLDKLEDFFTACSDEAVEGGIGFMHVTDLANPPPLAVELRNAYEKKHGAGTWDPTGLLYFSAWYSFLEAVKKADSLEVADIIAAYEGLEFDTASGPVIMVKRPDIEQTRYVESVHSYYYQEVKNGELVYLDSHTPEEVLGGVIGLLGHQGGWR